jgi:hypothetical protein
VLHIGGRVRPDIDLLELRVLVGHIDFEQVCIVERSHAVIAMWSTCVLVAGMKPSAFSWRPTKRTTLSIGAKNMHIGAGHIGVPCRNALVILSCKSAVTAEVIWVLYSVVEATSYKYFASESPYISWYSVRAAVWTGSMSGTEVIKFVKL